MNAGPAILRELRAEARSPVTHRARLAAAAVLLVLMIQRGSGGSIDPSMGKPFFLYLHASVYVLIWVLVPILLHDNISRERREGTLGLLLLTPLTGAGIIVAKGLAGLLRSSGILLAAVPILALPLLFGGVSAAEVMRAVLMELMALLGATAATLLGSSLSVERHRALIAALVLAFVFETVLAGIQAALMFGNRGLPADVLFNPVQLGMVFVAGGFWAATRVDMWAPPFWMTLASVWGALGLLVLVLALAGARLKDLAAATGSSRRQQQLFKFFCTPLILGELLRTRLNSALNRNPIGWLQQRRWTSRLSQWGWVAILLVTATWIITGSGRNLAQQFLWLALLLGANIALSAAGSFRDERQSGALELLMVTPLDGRQILLGRLRGLWAQFLIPVMLWCWMWWMIGTMPHGRSAFRGAHEWQLVWMMMLVMFASLPVIGVCQSLHCRSLMGAWMKTLAFGCLAPLVVGGLATFFTQFVLLYPFLNAPIAGPGTAAAFAQLLTLGWIARNSFARVVELLDRRQFVLDMERP